MTIACARCHDHKFDPIPTADYYALYGIFKSTNYAHPGTEIYPHTYGFTALNPSDAAKLKEVETQLSGLDNRIEDIKAGRIKFANDAEKRKAEQENQANVTKMGGGISVFAEGLFRLRWQAGRRENHGARRARNARAAGSARLPDHSRADRSCRRRKRAAAAWNWRNGLRILRTR